MKLKLPLYAKILSWFFLNLVLLGIIFLIVARAQFQFGLDWLMAGSGGRNVQNVLDLLSAELRDNPAEAWDGVLERLGESYHVRFYLFRGTEQVGGLKVDLPQPVRDKMPNRRAGAPPRLRQGEDGPFPPPGAEPPPDLADREVIGQRERPPQKSMIHTSGPGRYWVISPIIVPDKSRSPGPGGRGRIVPMTVLLSSDSLSANGLFFDATPWIIGGVAVVLISLLFWIPPVRGITRAISQMTRATERIAEGQFDIRSRVNRKDELGALSDSINQMAARLLGFVTGQKRFLGDIAHELCSPIARMQMALGILEQRAWPENAGQLKDLREEIEQISALVNELLSFSKASLAKSALKMTPISVRKLVEKAVNRERAPDDCAQVSVDVPDNLEVLGDPDLCLRALGNVLRNAIRYASKAGPIEVSAWTLEQDVLITVDDCGPGIPEEAIPRVFDPFYRVDTSRDRETGGTGLGLAIVKTCVESCGGRASCENRAQGGLRVSLRLPAAV